MADTTHKSKSLEPYFSSTTTSSIVVPVSLTSLCVAPAGIGSCQYAFPVS